jgi:hypothetical protein
MDLTELLRDKADDLVDGAVAQLHQARLKHYEAEGLQAARARLSTLLAQTLICLEERRAEPIVDWATRVSRERFVAGYDLFEVQTAINVLEEALWKRLLASLGPDNIAHALGLVNAIFGMAKDNLARQYVSFATNREAPALSPSELLPETESS